MAPSLIFLVFRGKGRVILSPAITTYKTRDSNLIARFFPKYRVETRKKSLYIIASQEFYNKICDFHDYSVISVSLQVIFWSEV